MRLRHIEIFQAVLQTGTLTGAAKLLNISQPAATKLLQHAEQQLGFSLFSRVLGRLQLTPEGHLLREQIDRISGELRDLRRLSVSIRRPDHHALRVISTPTLATVLLPKAITALRRQFGKAAIELSTHHTGQMVDSLLLLEADIGLTMQRVHHPAIHQQVVQRGRMVAIAPAGRWNPREMAKPVQLREMAGTSMIGIAPRDGLGPMLSEYLQYLVPAPKISIWVQTHKLARELVANGHGLALVDPFTVLDSGGEKIQVRNLEPVLEVELFVIHRKAARLTPIQKSFIEQIAKAAELPQG